MTEPNLVRGNAVLIRLNSLCLKNTQLLMLWGPEGWFLSCRPPRGRVMSSPTNPGTSVHWVYTAHHWEECLRTGLSTPTLP